MWVPVAVRLLANCYIRILYLCIMSWCSFVDSLHWFDCCDTAAVLVATVAPGTWQSGQNVSTSRLPRDDVLSRFRKNIMTFRSCKSYFERSFENLVVILSIFYRAMLCIRGTSHGPVSVCPSVCLSVRPSQVGVLLKRLNVGSHKQHHTIAQGL